MLTDSSRQRDFPSLGDRIYLNTAAEGIPPRQVQTALAQYVADKDLGMDGRPLHEAQWHGVKAAAALAFGLEADEIGVCSCSSEAYNLAAMALALKPEDEVIINDLDFPAGATPWLQRDCTVRCWQARDGVLHVEDLLPLLSPRTRLLTVSLVSFYNGFKIPLPAILRTVRQHSPALVAVDVTQALGRIPLELTDVDLIVSSTHKWILASHGGGLVGVPRRRAEQWTAPAGGWFNLENAFDPDRFERAITRAGAASFSVGMPNYPAAYAVRAGLDYVLATGIAKIDAHCRPLMAHCLAQLADLDIELMTPTDADAVAGIIAFRHPDADVINQRLHAQNIHIMAHAGRLRVAIHGYNTAGDIETFLKALRAALAA